MSKKRQAASKIKRRTISKTQPDWTHLIFLAARSAGKQSVQNNPVRQVECESRLADLVARALDTGSDKHVLRAMEDLEEAHLDDAAAMVAFWADDAASTLPDMVQNAGDWDVGKLELFLVPVLLMVDTGHAMPLQVPDTQQDDQRSPLDLCATSLRRYGLIGQEPSVAVLPWLYAYADLPVTWSGQRGMLRQFMGAISGQPSRLPPPEQTDVGAQPAVALRFVLFAVSSSLGDTDTGALLNGGFIGMDDLNDLGDAPDVDGIDGADPEVDPRLLAWQEDFGQTLTECLPGALSVRAGTPAWWDEAIHAGFDMRNLFGLITAVAPDGGQETMLSTHVAMGFYHVADTLELRIGITRDERFTGGFVWACHQDPEDEAFEAFEALEHMGVPTEQIHVATDILGDERCPDCGKPYFPSVRVDEDGSHEQLDTHGHGGSGHSQLH
ncbi:hypothetical protein HAP94_18175 [Acidithiobacillus ferrivorans]|nr:hypothetical protein [Acidithiobacillus ferrivorans]